MQEHQPKVSIVIPVYNVERKIKRCLNSLINQTMPDFEIVCVDDKSIDNSVGIIEKVMETEPRLSLLKSNENKGTLITRKKGVAVAKGEYIITSDADDWFEKDALEIAYKEINKKGVDILMYSARPVCIADNITEYEIKQRKELLISKPERCVGEHAIPKLQPMYHTWRRIVRRDVLKTAYRHAEDSYMILGEDDYICWLMHYFAKSFETVPNILYNWEMGDGVSSSRNRSLESFEKLCRSYYNYENALTNFYRNRSEKKMLEEHLRRVPGIRRHIWEIASTTVPTENAEEAVRIMSKFYGLEEVHRISFEAYASIHKTNLMQAHRISKLEKKCNKLRKEKKRMRY